MTFQITFSPVDMLGDLTLTASGDILTVNGDVLDFSDLPDGGEYPAEALDNPMVVGGVQRADGVIHITVILPYSNPDAPEAVRFPQSITVTTDGEIALPEGRDREEEAENAAE